MRAGSMRGLRARTLSCSGPSVKHSAGCEVGFLPGHESAPPARLSWAMESRLRQAERALHGIMTDFAGQRRMCGLPALA